MGTGFNRRSFFLLHSILISPASLTHRRRRAEIMDDPGLEAARHLRALRGLERINGICGSARILWPSLQRLARELPSSRLRILDLACGAGDVPIRLWWKFHKAGLSVDIEGWDISPRAVSHAQARALEHKAEIRFRQADVLRDPLPVGMDAVISSLFLHHLNEDQAEQFLKRMVEGAQHLVLVNDLIRCRLGWVLAALGTRIVSSSTVVHTDGPRSVEGAFTLKEVGVLAARCGLTGVSLDRWWPCRFLLSWKRP
jgi:SAM-dependent methyltransferase